MKAAFHRGGMPVYSRANSGALEPMAILVSFEFSL